MRGTIWVKQAQRAAHGPRGTRRPPSPIRFPAPAPKLPLTCGPKSFERALRPNSVSDIACHRVYTSARCPILSHLHHPILCCPAIKTGGARVSASESVAIALRVPRPHANRRRLRLAADSRVRSFRERLDPSCHGVHRRDAARASGPPPAQAAASGVGRRPLRDASGSAWTLWPRSCECHKCSGVGSLFGWYCFLSA